MTGNVDVCMGSDGKEVEKRKERTRARLKYVDFLNRCQLSIL